MKKLLRIDNLIITIIIFVFMWLFSLIPFKLIFLDPVTKALADFDIHDIVFSKLREEPVADTNIVIINIGELGRREIAAQIEIINSYDPAVIGIDALFFEEGDSLDDIALETAYSNCSRLVLAAELSDFNEEENLYEKFIEPVEIFKQYANVGFANLPTTGINSETIRNCRPSAETYSRSVNSFAAEIVAQFNHNSIKELWARNNNVEAINYRGNLNKFYVFDHSDIFNPSADLSILKNKIVLMGYLGETLFQKDLTDIYFTPLNESYAGRTFPDMYGVVIHANIISMIINQDYIDVMPGWLSLLLAFILCFLNVFLIKSIYENLTDYYGGLVKILIFFQTLIILFINVFVFDLISYKISLTIALIAIILSPSSVVLYEKLFKNYAKSYRNKRKSRPKE